MVKSLFPTLEKEARKQTKMHRIGIHISIGYLYTEGNVKEEKYKNSSLLRGT